MQDALALLGELLTFALLHAIDDNIRKEMYSASTERLQTWLEPKPTKKDPTMANQLFKCKCTKTSTLDSHNSAFEKVMSIFATPFAESSRNLHNIRFHKTLSLPAAVCGAKIAVDMPDPQSTVRKTGLVIHPLDQYIAASPDGLIRSGEDYMLLEIKSIFNPDGSSLEGFLSKRPDFCLSYTNGFISLKNKS
ncbi:SWIM-type domain-containing protein [Nephila pilipes]|uniref:SWIM-type domain-containing protein n=1 Tax=Nephila pilipes TaxID=299642 RepID=A0A8X6QRU1_NEPPI|nr:SWIM-type domain-containing protein [Nephila pilipes]